VAQDQGQYVHINTATTTVINPARSGGVLKGVYVGTGGAGWTATIYDNVTGSGEIIAVVSGTNPIYMPFNLQYKNGLTVVTAGSPGDLTVVFT
jgi:hypothetical protein